ncbi:MAG: anthranilate synthase component I family protein [Methermicoccaceae archaeon]
MDSKVNSGTLRMSNPLNKKERTKDRYGALSDRSYSLLPEGICQIIPSIKELATLQEDHKIDKKQNKPIAIQFFLRLSEEFSSLTPPIAYSSLSNATHSDYSYILESVEKESRAAVFSFVGYSPAAIIEVNGKKGHIKRLKADAICSLLPDSVSLKQGDGFDVLREFYPPNFMEVHTPLNFGRQVFTGGMVGCIGYDIVYGAWIERERKANDGGNDRKNVPDAIMMLSTEMLLFDHSKEQCYVVITRLLDDKVELEDVVEDVLSNGANVVEILREGIRTGNPHPNKAKTQPFSSRFEKEHFKGMVSTVKRHIMDGDAFQIVISRKYSSTTEATPLDSYLMLRSINPSPYMYLIRFNGLAVVGASPETLLSLHHEEGDGGYKEKLTINPIAGTCPRSQAWGEERSREDAVLAAELLKDEKEIAEHIMLVDLGRNDVRSVCKPGSVVVEDMMTVVKYSHVQHIESKVSGILRDECDVFDSLRAVFPAGTLSGAPKIRAMEIISELESEPRGFYGGGIGYISMNKSADFAITIRTIVHNHNHIEVQAGAGIVADSDPENEYMETERKMQPMLEVFHKLEDLEADGNSAHGRGD